MTKKLDAFLNSQRQKVTERLIEDIQGKKLDWIQEWMPPSGEFYNPYSSQSGYRGRNVAHLMYHRYVNEFTDSRYATLKQLKKHHLRVKDSEFKNDAVVEYWKRIQYTKTIEEDGEEKEKHYSFWKPVSFYTVYNFDQLEEKPKEDSSRTFDTLEPDEITALADRVMSRWHSKEGVVYKEDSSSSGAFYRPSTDMIHMPERKYFTNSESFLRTLLHETTHSTGAEKRLNREIRNEFGSQKYAFEELVAEMGALFTATALHAPIGEANERAYKNHVAYLQSWLQALHDDPDFLFKAATKAQEASDMILDRVQGEVRTLPTGEKAAA